MEKGLPPGGIWLDVTLRDSSSTGSDANPFVFSNGAKVEDTNVVIRWDVDQPFYSLNNHCSYLAAGGLKESGCIDYYAALCKTKGKCEEEEECPINNESGRSRANLPVFALFMAGSVFRAFYALVGPVA